MGIFNHLSQLGVMGELGLWGELGIDIISITFEPKKFCV
jgi:hypothetical protein